MDLNNAKVVAGIGAVLAGVGFLGYGALGIVGIVMFLVGGIIEIAGNLRDNALRSDAIAWFILTIVAFAVFIVAYSCFSSFTTLPSPWWS